MVKMIFCHFVYEDQNEKNVFYKGMPKTCMDISNMLKMFMGYATSDIIFLFKAAITVALFKAEITVVLIRYMVTFKIM